MDNLEICYMSVLEMANAIKTKKLSPVEIMNAVLYRIEELNPKVNAYCTVVAEDARKQATAYCSVRLDTTFSKVYNTLTRGKMEADDE